MFERHFTVSTAACAITGYKSLKQYNPGLSNSDRRRYGDGDVANAWLCHLLSLSVSVEPMLNGYRQFNLSFSVSFFFFLFFRLSLFIVQGVSLDCPFLSFISWKVIYLSSEEGERRSRSNVTTTLEPNVFLLHSFLFSIMAAIMA